MSKSSQTSQFEIINARGIDKQGNILPHKCNVCSKDSLYFFKDMWWCGQDYENVVKLSKELDDDKNPYLYTTM